MRRLVVAALRRSPARRCSNNLPAASFIDKLRVLACGRAARGGAGRHHGAARARRRAAGARARRRRAGGRDGGVAGVRAAVGHADGAPCGVGSGMSASTMPPFCNDQPSAPLCIIGTARSELHDGRRRARRRGVDAAASDGRGRRRPTRARLACLLDIANNGGLPTDPDHCVVSLKRLDHLRSGAARGAGEREPDARRLHGDDAERLRSRRSTTATACGSSRPARTRRHGTSSPTARTTPPS